MRIAHLQNRKMKSTLLTYWNNGQKYPWQIWADIQILCFNREINYWKIRQRECLRKRISSSVGQKRSEKVAEFRFLTGHDYLQIFHLQNRRDENYFCTFCHQNNGKSSPDKYPDLTEQPLDQLLGNSVQGMSSGSEYKDSVGQKRSEKVAEFRILTGHDYLQIFHLQNRKLLLPYLLSQNNGLASPKQIFRFDGPTEGSTIGELRNFWKLEVHRKHEGLICIWTKFNGSTEEYV